MLSELGGGRWFREVIPANLTRSHPPKASLGLAFEFIEHVVFAGMLSGVMLQVN